MKTTAIFYIGYEAGCWTVRRFGRPLSYWQTVDAAIKAGRHVAKDMAARGRDTELRLRRPRGGPPARYKVEARYSPASARSGG